MGHLPSAQAEQVERQTTESGGVPAPLSELWGVLGVFSEFNGLVARAEILGTCFGSARFTRGSIQRVH